jgi:CBS domain-containing protein
VDELTVREIMTTDVITAKPDTTVGELADILAKNKISGVPVVDNQGRVLGMVSEADIILQDADLHSPYYIQFLESVIYLQSVHKFEERFRKSIGSKVSEVMSEEVNTVPPDTTVRQAATMMAECEVNRLPVTDEDGRLVGIVTRGDIVRAIAEHRV